MTATLLRADGLRAGYGRAAVLDEVSLHVDEGELVTLIGPNGAGKTTLLNTLAGLIRPTAGTVELFGAPAARLSTERRVALGCVLVPETRDLFGSMPVSDNLLLGAFSRRAEPAAAIRASLDEVYRMLPRLAERRDQPAQTLSGGERQMLALGRAFMARPRLLLLDEPSLGLAPLIVRDIIDVVRRLCDRGIAVLLVEQNANLALSIADRGHVMENGRIVATGSAQALRSDPAVRATYLGVQVESSGSPAPRHNVSA